MTEKETIKQLQDLISDFNLSDGFDIRVNATDVKALQTVLQLLEQKDNKINKVIEYCNETIEFKDAMNERYDDCYDILKMLEE